MDRELRGWAEEQTAATQAIAAEQQRLADAVTLLAREVAAIGMMLAPRASEEPSPLEQLLAQLVAQGKEQLFLLRALAREAVQPEGGDETANGTRRPGNANGPPAHRKEPVS